MIQRIQTLYLFLAFLLSIGLIFLINLKIDVGGEKFTGLYLLEKEEFTLKLIPILFIVSGVLCLASILSFKNRKNQFVINRLNILANLTILGVLIYFLFVATALPSENLSSDKGLGTFIPLIVIILLVMANKAIQKDENLIKSVDRLR